MSIMCQRILINITKKDHREEEEGADIEEALDKTD